MHMNLLRRLYEDYLLERMELVGEEYRKTERYRELLKKEKELYEGLKERLPCELKLILVSYTDVLYYIMIEQREFFFRYGLCECCKFKISSRVMNYLIFIPNMLLLTEIVVFFAIDTALINYGGY